MASQFTRRGATLLIMISLGVNAQFSKKITQEITYYKGVHGVIMTVAFAILFPLAAALVRFIPYKGQIWVHAGIQFVAYVLAIAGLGTGIWLAQTTRNLASAHAVIGMLVIGSLFFQFPLGLIHHYAWKGQHRRTVWAYAHLIVGRIMLILGGINGGLGLQLASAYGVKPKHWMPVYIVLAAIFYALWFLVAATALMKSRNREVPFETGEKLIQPKTKNLSMGSPDGSQE